MDRSVARWRQIPDGAVRRRGRIVRSVVILGWIGLAGPLTRSWLVTGGEPLQVALVGAMAGAALVAAARSSWILRLLITAVVVVLLQASQGDLIAVWTGVGLLLGMWVAFGARPAPFFPTASPDAVAPVVVLGAVAAWQGAGPDATWQPFVPLALACVVVSISGIGGGAMHRAAAKFGHAAGSAVSAALFSLLGVIVVLAPWVAQRTLQTDPLGPRSGWSGRDRRSVQTGRPWAEEQGRPDRSRLRRRRWVLLIVAVLSVYLWQERSGSLPMSDSSDLLSDADDVAEDQGWRRELGEDMAWVLDDRVAMRPFELYRIWDVRTRHVNVRDGRRVSWVAPECDCGRISLWLYGGSAAFGLDQRDHHTIASELARVAFENGIVLDVRNGGVPGQLHGRGAFRFSWELSLEPAPDLVVFYDGAHDVESALSLVARGLGDTRTPYEPFGVELYEDLFEVPEDLVPPKDVEYLGWPTLSDAPLEDPGGLAALRYERSRRLSEDAAVGAGVSVRWFWQPASGGVSPGADSDAAAHEAASRRAAELLAPEVTDLSGLLDAAPGQVLDGGSLHGESGARLVAEAIFEHVEAELERIALTRGKP